MVILRFTMLGFCTAVACEPKVPEPWAALGMPVQGIAAVHDDTSDQRFSADYKGVDAKELIARTEGALVAAQYLRKCEAFEGWVRGYAKGTDRLLVKVDLLGPVTALTVGTQSGSDELVFGACFGDLELGPPVRVK